MIVKSKRENSVNLSVVSGDTRTTRAGNFARLSLLVLFVAISSFVSAQQTTIDSSAISVKEPFDDGFPTIYKDRPVAESEFDNNSASYVKDWRKAVPADDYEDTDFGDLMYNEASIPTKLEVLRLLSKDTPSILVFMTALSMGLDIEGVLQASVNYQPNKSRDLASSAVSVLPVVSEAESYLYSAYQVEDLEREDETAPYSVSAVIENFFEKRSVLRPYPDWLEGQYHFLASAAELKGLQLPNKTERWYGSNSTRDIKKRPIFVSLYEHDKSILIDGEERINKALNQNANAVLPVVFVFNRLNERAISQLEYPNTIKGLRDAYQEKGIMLTPTPEWQLGEYHFLAQIDEVKESFDLPLEDDFEPEAWQSLLEEAENYSVADTSFIFVLVDGSDAGLADGLAQADQQLYAAWDDPRSEGAFPYVAPKGGPAMTLKSIASKGLIINRPDLISALGALGVKKIPVSFYYLNSARVKAYNGSAQALLKSVIGLGIQRGSFGGGGITPPPPPPPVCASPPCTQ